MKKSITVFILLGIMMLISVTCSNQKTFYYVTYEGHVYDKSGNLAPDIVVVLLGCPMGTSGDNAAHCNCDFFEVGRSTTDASGHFYIKEKAARTDKYSAETLNHTLQVRLCTNKAGLEASDNKLNLYN